MELHEVKMVNPNVFMGMDVVKRCLFLQDQTNPLTKVNRIFPGGQYSQTKILTLRWDFIF